MIGLPGPGKKYGVILHKEYLHLGNIPASLEESSEIVYINKKICNYNINIISLMLESDQCIQRLITVGNDDISS